MDGPQDHTNDDDLRASGTKAFTGDGDYSFRSVIPGPWDPLWALLRDFNMEHVYDGGDLDYISLLADLLYERLRKHFIILPKG